LFVHVENTKAKLKEVFDGGDGGDDGDDDDGDDGDDGDDDDDERGNKKCMILTKTYK
jgi:hypothetical protein